MLALYYQMKTKKRKLTNATSFEEYYRDTIDELDARPRGNLSTKCRVCLREGTSAIYGNNHTQDIVEMLEILGKIQLNENDEFPKYLCTTCVKFIKTAIAFRKTAKHSDDLLNKPVKEELVFEQSEDHHDQSDGSVYNETDQKWEDNHILKKEKKDTLKYSPKVTCHICNKVINRSYYKEHITMHDPDHKKYVCDICGKSFRLRCAYHNHSLRHRTDFPYKCQFCPYRGRYAELLKTHMRTHTGDYRYMCTECPARFLFKSNLNSHMLKHKEPKFKCDACKRAFHTKLMLQRHFEADHLGIKNHVCSICGKAFGYRNAMMKHQRHVHKREKMLFGRMPAYLQAQCRNQDVR